MRGRIFGIKKSIMLWTCAITLFFAFVGATTASTILLKIPDLWFYNFCICLGLFETIKSTFFNLDSSLYFGSLLQSIGSVGYVFWTTNTNLFAPAYILLAFSVASFVTFVFCGQRFQLIISFSLFFVTTYTFLFIKTLITWPIFIAFVGGFLLLLILELIIYIKRGI